jgi:pyrimidine-nucleoside phosphorylase
VRIVQKTYQSQQMKMHISAVNLIRKKRDGKQLGESEIRSFINAYTRGNIPDYQMSAFLMAVYFQGMDSEETTYLMQSMMRSGKILDLSGIQGVKIDKHSTGGVGDKVSLVLAPLVASCGVCVPMISGRGLGHTGGTLDKLESIPGFRTDLSANDFKKQLDRIGVAMIGQTAEIAPADKKMYALRDVTATVESIPLIAASIMSKKLAEDLDGLILDVKFGSGAFMREYKKAKLLARAMVQIGKQSKVKTTAVLTNMDNPLGVSIGNSLEVIETIEALMGKGPGDLMKVTIALGAQMLRLAHIRGGIRMLKHKITSGQALDKFRQIIESQGGDPRVIEDYKRLPVAKKSVKVIAQKTGYIHDLDTYALGMLLVKLGGGRLRKEDNIDPSCGFKIYKKIGDHASKGEFLAEVFSSNVRRANAARADVQNMYTIKRDKPSRRILIRETISES